MRSDAKAKVQAEVPARTKVPMRNVRGGITRSSDEVSVMGMDAKGLYRLQR